MYFNRYLLLNIAMNWPKKHNSFFLNLNLAVFLHEDANSFQYYEYFCFKHWFTKFTCA